MRSYLRTVFMSVACIAPLLVFDAAVTQNKGLPGVYAINPGQDANVDAAIEAVVAGMNFIKRPIARGRLKKINPTYQRITIEQSPEEISIAFDSRKPVQTPADGHAVKWTREDGEVFDVSVKRQGNRLEQHFKAEDGDRTNTYTLGDDGASLRLDVVITSAQLPTPVKYTLNYRRSGG